MVSISKRNKRTSLHQKYKVAKKVRQHHKKANQALKKLKPKKDKPVSIPMDVPFKADILKGIEESKLQEKLMNTKRLIVLSKLKNKPVVNEFDALKSKLLKDPTKSFVNDLKTLLTASNVIIQVLDARDPNGTRSLEAEKEIKILNKPLIFVLNKIDLVPADNLNLWIKHLSKEGKVIPFKSSCQTDNILFKAELNLQKKSKAGNVYGSEELMNHIMSLMKGSENMGKSLEKIVVGVIGLPNTGKSSIINSLKKKIVCVVGKNPATTRVLNRIDLNGKVTIIDSPCIVVSKSNDEIELAERNCIKLESISEASSKAENIFNQCNKEHLRLHYTMSLFADYEQFILDLATGLHLFKKGGIPQLNTAARRIFDDWHTGKIAHWTMPPTNDCDNKICVFTDVQKATLKKLNSKYVHGFAGFSVVESSGPLMTVMDTAELTEEDDDEECGSCHGCDDEDCEDGSCSDDCCDMDE